MIKRAIIGFHQDEFEHWVAELACGHRRHMRHDPPWQVREWVITESGRNGRLGSELECVECQRQSTGEAGR